LLAIPGANQSIDLLNSDIGLPGMNGLQKLAEQAICREFHLGLGKVPGWITGYAEKTAITAHGFHFARLGQFWKRLDQKPQASGAQNFSWGKKKKPQGVFLGLFLGGRCSSFAQ